MHPLYPINDAPPCTPLPIVKRVCAEKPHKSRLLGIAKGGANAPPQSIFCTPSTQKLDTRIEKLVMRTWMPDKPIKKLKIRFGQDRSCSAFLSVGILVLPHIIPRRFVADLISFCCFISCEFAVVNPTVYVQSLLFCVLHVANSCRSLLSCVQNTTNSV